MSKYRVLWIDDKFEEMHLMVKKWRIDPAIDIELVGYKFALNGMAAFDAAPDSWDAVILDAQQLYADASEGTSLKGLRECRDFFKSHVNKVPFFIFTGDPKCKSDTDFAILMGQRIYKKGNEQDVADLARDIHLTCDAFPKKDCERSTQMRFAYALNTQKKYWKLPLLLKKGKPIMQRYLILCATSLNG